MNCESRENLKIAFKCDFLLSLDMIQRDQILEDIEKEVKRQNQLNLSVFILEKLNQSFNNRDYRIFQSQMRNVEALSRVSLNYDFIQKENDLLVQFPDIMVWVMKKNCFNVSFTSHLAFTHTETYMG